MKVILKKSVPVVLSVMLLFVGIVPVTDVHAENHVNQELYLTKIFSKPDYGVATPNVTFNFKIDKVGIGPDTSDAAKNNMPELAVTSVSYQYTDNETGLNSSDYPGCHLVKPSNDMLDEVQFTHGSGQYVYRVTEIAPSNVSPSTAAPAISISGAEYLLSIFIKYDESESKNVVDSISIRKTKDDKGNTVTQNKVDYVEGSTDATTGFVFKNQYRPKGGIDTTGGTTITAQELSGFVLMKELVGSTDDISFPMTIYVDPPWGISTDGSELSYRIVSRTGSVENKVPINYESTYSISLKRGERLVLNDVLLGSFIRLEETDSKHYIKTMDGLMNGIDPNNYDRDIVNDGLPIGEQTGPNATGNWFKFINTKQDPTGVLLANLPFIILFLVAAGGITLFVINRRRAHSE